MMIVGLVNVAPDTYVVQALDREDRLVECSIEIHEAKSKYERDAMALKVQAADAREKAQAEFKVKEAECQALQQN